MTTLLYDENAYLSDFEAQVVSCDKTDKGFDIILDKTAFFPEEGGQKCDTGRIANANVKYVRIENGTVIHTADAEVSGRVSCKINFKERFDKMQQHTGEHIVSGIVFEKYGYNNVGFHLADDEVTFDFDGTLTRAQLDEIEDMANAVVFENRSIKCYYPEQSELENLSYRSKLDLTENVRIVEIEGVDKCACCAPHVSTTGQVGIIKLLDCISYKGGVRITMVCGDRALKDYRIKCENLSVISKALSAPINSTAQFFEKYKTETESLKQTLSELRREIVTLKANAVTAVQGNLILFEDGLDMNMLRNFVNLLSGKYTGICAVFSKTENGFSYVAASESVNMRDIAKKMQSELSSKGGGSDKMIQGNTTATKAEISDFFNK